MYPGIFSCWSALTQCPFVSTFAIRSWFSASHMSLLLYPALKSISPSTPPIPFPPATSKGGCPGMIWIPSSVGLLNCERVSLAKRQGGAGEVLTDRVVKGSVSILINKRVIVIHPTGSWWNWFTFEILARQHNNKKGKRCGEIIHFSIIDELIYWIRVAPLRIFHKRHFLSLIFRKPVREVSLTHQFQLQCRSTACANIKNMETERMCYSFTEQTSHTSLCDGLNPLLVTNSMSTCFLISFEPTVEKVALVSTLLRSDQLLTNYWCC